MGADRLLVCSLCFYYKRFLLICQDRFCSATARKPYLFLQKQRKLWLDVYKRQAFAVTCKFSYSLLGGAITMALMVLPVSYTHLILNLEGIPETVGGLFLLPEGSECK